MVVKVDRLLESVENGAVSGQHALPHGLARLSYLYSPGTPFGKILLFLNHESIFMQLLILYGEMYNINEGVS